ncbi:RING finger family protein [Quillaja saponaria]|uniref:RING finger family protein n=1 Tax=Quillaja saponaria TaxID=32244 RepID=A0AAD7LBK7_QUISA|nr:RING finger family protein [Quillaja saponaria]
MAASSSMTVCSVCLDDVSEKCGRTVVTLQCSHIFHLDCIGSAFNMKGVMECPNCRQTEKGVWKQFEDGNHEEDMVQGILFEDGQDFAEMDVQEPGPEYNPFQQWSLGLQSPGYQGGINASAIFVGPSCFNHQWSNPSATQFLEAIGQHHQFCNQHFISTSFHDHFIGAHQSLVPSVTLAPAGANFVEPFNHWCIPDHSAQHEAAIVFPDQLVQGNSSSTVVLGMLDEGMRSSELSAMERLTMEQPYNANHVSYMEQNGLLRGDEDESPYVFG